MKDTPRGARLRIALVGRRNAGKSSLINALTGQQTAIVSEIPGTTTDPVFKAMELQPLGPVLFVDTAGLDDAGVLGEQRVSRSRRALDSADLVILVVDATVGIGSWEEGVLRRAAERGVRLLVAWNKVDLVAALRELPALPGDFPLVAVSARTRQGVEDLRQAIIRAAPADWSGQPIIADLLAPGDTVVLVAPQDIEAPRGRLILPQVQTIREILDANAAACVVKEDGLERLLGELGRPPRLVVTDSQVFRAVERITPPEVPLTAFSILFARHRGDIAQLVAGAAAVDHLEPGDAVLVAEACTHHPIGDDIGRVKIPRLLEERVGGRLRFTWVAGGDFPDAPERFRLVVHCGACMIGRREMLLRLHQLETADVPVVNYGVLIAYLLGILERALGPVPGALEAWRRARAETPPCRSGRSEPTQRLPRTPPAGNGG